MMIAASVVTRSCSEGILAVCIINKKVFATVHEIVTKSHQDKPWKDWEVKQISEEAFGAQPTGGLCSDCGDAVDILMLTEEMSKEEIIEKTGADRTFIAKLLLIHGLKDGSIPKGFNCSMVKTTQTVGHSTNVACLGVKCTHFKRHPDLKLDPETFPGTKLQQKTTPIIKSELGVDSCIAMADDGEVPSNLPTSNITLFHRTEVQLVEYHLTPDTHLVPS